MNALVVLILIGAAGFVLGRFLFLRPRPGSWMERFFLSGAEFLILGALIGPRGLGVLDEESLRNLEPFLVLALSWVGLLVGLQLRWRHMTRFPWTYFQVSLVQSVTAFALTLGALAAAFHLWTPNGATTAEVWRAAFCLAAVAALSSPTETMLHEQRHAHGGHAAGLLRFVPAVDPLVSLLGVAVLFSFWHVTSGTTAGAAEAIGWLAISVVGGLALGALFLGLLWAATEADEVVLVVLGMALFAGGLATVFHLSPLVVSLVVGVVLGNWRKEQERLLHMFLRIERPLYVALVVLAGAAWRFDDVWGYVLAATFILLRITGKFTGVKLALAVTRLGFPLPSRWWMGLLPQGAMAIAIAVSFAVIFRDDLAQTVFAGVLVSTVVLTFVSRRVVERALTPDKDGAP